MIGDFPMREIIYELNEMSFELPEGWAKTKDIYDLPNGQGMTNIANYLSKDGDVISLFAVHRNPDEFFASYDRVTKNIDNVTGKFNLISCPSIKLNGFIFPSYIIHGHDDKCFIVQVFCNCGDCLACFMVNLKDFNGNFASALKEEHILQELVKLLKTIE